MVLGIRQPRSPIARGLLWAGLGFLALVAVAAGAAALRLASIAGDLREARGILDEVGTAVEDGRLADARTGLTEANSLLVSANNQLYESPLDAIGWLPVARENLSSLRQSVGTALSLSTGGIRLLEVARPLENEDGSLEVPLRGGAIPIEAVVAAGIEAESLAIVLPAEPDADDDLLIGSVAELQERVGAEAGRRRDQLVDLSNGLRLIAEMSGANGPRRYLIAVANTAEMRATGGMILSYGVLESEAGDFELTAFGGIDELFLAAAVDPEALDVPADELRRWSGLQPTRLWRNVNLVPDMSVVGPRMEAMYEAATGLPVDGVIQIDASGLAAILAGIGPVTVEGVGEVTATNVVDLTLNTAYTLFPDRDQRQEVLGDVAEAVFDRLVEGEYDSLRPLGTALLDAAARRHVVLWSSRSEAARASTFFGADAPLPDPGRTDHLLLTVQNFGRDKLDYYVDTAVRVRGDRPVGEPSRVEVTVEVANTAPPGEQQPLYVFGDPEIRGDDLAIGTFAGDVSLYVPTGTVLVGSEGGPSSEPALTTEGGRSVVGFEVEVPAGEARAVTLVLSFPPRPRGPYRLELVPVPRVRPTVWDVDIGTGTGASVTRSGPLERPEFLTAR